MSETTDWEIILAGLEHEREAADAMLIAELRQAEYAGERLRLSFSNPDPKMTPRLEAERIIDILRAACDYHDRVLAQIAAAKRAKITAFNSE